MEADEKTPWWVAIPFSLGWTMLGIFSPTFLPEWTQAIFFAGAMISFAGGFGAYVWHCRFRWGRSVTASILVMALGVILAVVGCFLAWLGARGFYLAYAKENDKTQQAAPPTKELNRAPLTMREVFDSDFSGIGKIYKIQRLVSGTIHYSFPANLYLDLFTSSYFMAFYLDRDQPIETLSMIIGECAPEIVANLGQIELEVNIAGTEQIVSSRTMTFSKQIYIYYDFQITLQQKSSIDAFFKRLGLSYVPRDGSYLALHWREFDRVPHSADDAPHHTGVQLPIVDIGSTVKVVNNSGSLPPATTCRLSELLSTLTPPAPPAGTSPQTFP